MFPVMKMDTEEMVLRPMNCPHHMLIYKNAMHSYRDLPIKLESLHMTLDMKQVVVYVVLKE